jgi:hypothetical protein
MHEKGLSKLLSGT